MWVDHSAYDIRFPYCERVLLTRGDPALGELIPVLSPESGRLIFKRTRISTGAVIAIAVVAALAGALVVRQGAVLGQQRDAEQAQLQAQEAQLLDKIRKLETEKDLLERKAVYLQALLQTRDVDLDQNRKDKELRDNSLAQARQPRWEYRVLTSSGTDKVMTQEICKLTDDGWEYVAVIQPGLPQTP